MMRLGHYGAAMLALAPVIALLGPGDGVVAIVGLCLSLSATRLPDIDQRVPFVPHRGPTHTVWFGLILGAAAGAFLYGTLPGAGRSLLVIVAIAPIVGVLSHLAADAITPAGIRPFWPLRERGVALAIVRTENWIANMALLVLGVVALVAAALQAGLIAG